MEHFLDILVLMVDIVEYHKNQLHIPQGSKKEKKNNKIMLLISGYSR